jgi:hypothetical protein
MPKRFTNLTINFWNINKVIFFQLKFISNSIVDCQFKSKVTCLITIVFNHNDTINQLKKNFWPLRLSIVDFFKERKKGALHRPLSEICYCNRL